MVKSFRLALCQMKVTANRIENIEKAEDNILSAVSEKADVVILPEMFVCPYDTSIFQMYSEPENGMDALDMLKKQALKNKIYIVGGSIPESHDLNIYNTSYVFGPDGNIIAKHRKVHMFDLDIPGKITFRESESISKGIKSTTFKTNIFNASLAICYDIRFPEFIKPAAEKSDILFLPANFNMTTGPAHWELLIRARAVDSQIYVAACSAASNHDLKYVTYGHSMVCDPMGNIIASSGFDETIIYADIKMGFTRFPWFKTNTYK